MKTTLTIAAALSTALLMGAATQAQAQGSIEKCYGVAKAGKNDCQTARSSCAGTSKKDGEASAWLGVPKGTCEKIVGGKLNG
ncbi:DUF2282 domain-containing protein [Reyranella sp.]|uniref:BufA1 family periplasmic bufferin-type metallophore n=1 Tax=Reyranella sp. TaxID=1929291 RepID=UPI003BACDFAF